MPAAGLSPISSGCWSTTRPGWPPRSCSSSSAVQGRVEEDFEPTRTYRSLPVSGLPLWQRVLLVLRHEPAWAPESVAARGGGADGARNALAAAAARTVAAAARDGVALRPVGSAEAAALLRELGDPAAGGDVGTAMVTTSTGCHATLSVSLQDEGTLGAVLGAAAELDVDRAVLSVTANAVDHSVCAVVRLVAADPDRLPAAVEELVAAGVAAPLPDAQDAGLVATLPLGGGARSLADLVNQERM